MVAPHGTYAAIVFPVFLPKGTVRALLPQWVRDAGDPLLPLPPTLLPTLGAPPNTADIHLLLVQLGWQAGTGIGPKVLGMHFHELKIDVPYVRHPQAQRSLNGPVFTYKLSIGFDLRLLHLAGWVALGPERCLYAGAGAIEGIKRTLRLSHPPTSAAAVKDSGAKGVHPHSSPSLAVYPAHAPTIAYAAPGYVSVEFQRSTDEVQSWDAIKNLVTLPWFAGGTGKDAIEFDFSFADSTTKNTESRKADAPLAPELYTISSGVLLPTFLGTRESIASAAATARSDQPGIAHINPQAGLVIPPGTLAWRFTAPYEGHRRPVSSYQ